MATGMVVSLEAVELDKIIVDARAKGADIASWGYSKNNKIFIKNRHGELLCYSSLFAAGDHIIHRFNLTRQYRHLYEKSRKPVNNISVPPASTSGITQKDIVFLCGNLLEKEIDAATKHKIYRSIYRLHAPHSVTAYLFFSAKKTLLAHYGALHEGARGLFKEERFRLKNLIRLLEHISYNDFSVLH